ncbi:MAG: hypothetical protein NVS4B12_01930 [Ktedonobacteraceae bacterium]
MSISRRRLQQQKVQVQRIFTATEVAEFEYCPLVWWHEQFEPASHADSEELFARLVELEHDHDTQATAMPEYQMIEQLLVKRGAFEVGRQQHQDHAEEVAEIEEERVSVPMVSTLTRPLLLAAVIIVAVAVVLILIALVLR